MGAVTPLGHSVAETWSRAIAGASGVGRLERFEGDGYPSQVAGEVRGFEPRRYMPRTLVDEFPRFGQLAMAAAREAYRHAGLHEQPPQATRSGFILGNSTGGAPEVEADWRRRANGNGAQPDPLLAAKMLPNFATGAIARELRLAGFNTTLVTACAAGSHAIGESAEVIRRGAADLMIAGGSEGALCEIAHAGFSVMRALATSRNDDPARASRPFDRDRDGFVPGEGAGMVVLEALDHAQQRGAEPLAELLGYAVSSDASHLVAPSDHGEGAARAIRWALDDAGVRPEEIDYISAHATSTAAGDVAETQALRNVFGERAYEIPISALKSQTGHLLGGSGAVETIAAIQTIRTGAITPTLNLDHPDPECDLDYVPRHSREADVRTVVKNSFAFGGQNVVLVLRRWDG